MGILSDNKKLSHAEILCIQGMILGFKDITPMSVQAISRVLGREQSLIKKAIQDIELEFVKATEASKKITEETKPDGSKLDGIVFKHRKGTGIVTLTQGGSEAGDVKLTPTKQVSRTKPAIHNIWKDNG